MSRIIAARRSAIVPRGGAFKAFDVHQLAAPVICQCLADAGLAPQDVGELILSNALGAGGNPARIAALEAGLPEHVAGLSIDRQCAGGLDAILLGIAMVEAGLHDVVIAGGAESYSRRPIRAKTYVDGRAPEPYTQAAFTPWPARDPDMAEAAEQLAQRLGIDRATQEAWAMRSHRLARQSRFASDHDTAEIVALGGVQQDAFTRDLTPRHCQRAPVVTGSITAATMAVAADAAAFVVIARQERHMRPGLRLCAGRTLGGDPTQPGLVPVAAIRAVLDATGQSVQALSRAEIMEAFAVQALACIRGAELPEAICNPCGGALAQGHPVGASGAVLAVRLFHALEPGDAPALAAIAAAGGLGCAALFEAVA